MPRWYNLRCPDCAHTEYRYRNVKTCRQCGSHNVERVPDMPHVDTNAPLATNSDAAMWRQDHASACRYIEALLAEREESMAVVEASREYVRFRYVHGINDRQYRQEVLREKHDKIVEAVNALERHRRGEWE